MAEVLRWDGATLHRDSIGLDDLAADAGLLQQASALARPLPPFAGLAMDRPVLMGVVNVTPDSFSDGGQFAAPEAAIAHGQALLAAGARVLDIGGESTRPGAEPVSPQQEQDRILPVISGLAHAAAAMGAVLSVDTRHPATMRAAVAAGAAIVNDVTALTGAPDTAATVADLAVPAVLMHMRGEPRTMQQDIRYHCAILEVYAALAGHLAAARAAGIAALAADYGIGFGKTVAQNAALIGHTSLFHGLGVPLVVGVSRKSFIGKLAADAPVQRRVPGSLAAGLEALRQGAQILRVHDVAETAQAVAVLTALDGD